MNPGDKFTSRISLETGGWKVEIRQEARHSVDMPTCSGGPGK